MNIFKFEGTQEIRTSVDSNTGNPLFCVRDVLDVLGLKSTKVSEVDFEESELIRIEVNDSRNILQKTYFCNEPGIYRLIFRSKKQVARKFQNWVFNEVLPTIRTSYCITSKLLDIELEPSQRYTYLIKNSTNGLTKIGRTENLFKRFKQLQNVYFDNKLVLVGCVDEDIELKLHREWYDYNYHGEWFSLSNSQISDILFDNKFSIFN